MRLGHWQGFENNVPLVKYEVKECNYKSHFRQKQRVLIMILLFSQNVTNFSAFSHTL